MRTPAAHLTGRPAAYGPVPCRVCAVVQPRQPRGDKDRQGRAIAIDDHGHRWNGLECPSCYAKRHTEEQAARNRARPRQRKPDDPAPTAENTSACSTCGHHFWRIRAERRTSAMRWNYRDEQGRLWAGRICPDCNNERRVAHMQVKRAKAREAAGASSTTRPRAPRRTPTPGVVLPQAYLDYSTICRRHGHEPLSFDDWSARQAVG